MNTSQAASSGSRPFVIIPTFIVGHFSHHLCTAALVPLLPMVRDSFGLDYLQAGLLLSSFSLTYGFAQLPMAVIADRLSKRRIISLGMLGVGCSCIGAGLSTDYSQLLFCLILMGVTGASYHAPASAFLSQTFASSRLGRSYGMHLIGGAGGFMVAPMVAILVANATGSWRNSFLVMGIPVLIVGVLFWTVLRAQEAANIKAVARDKAVPLRPAQVLRVLGPLVVIAILTRLLSSALSSFFPLYLVDKHGVARDAAGLTMSLLYGSELVGAPFGGALSDRFGRKPVLLFSVVVMGPMMWLVTMMSYGPLMAGAIFLYGVVIVFRSPTIESFIGDTIPVRQRSTVLGVYHFLSQESTGVATPVFGFVLDQLGPTDGFSALAGVAVACSLLVLVLWRKI